VPLRTAGGIPSMDTPAFGLITVQPLSTLSI